MMAMLVRMRREAGWSQGKMATQLGMYQSALSQMENLITVPTLVFMDRYAGLLGYRVVCVLEELPGGRHGG